MRILAVLCVLLACSELPAQNGYGYNPYPQYNYAPQQYYSPPPAYQYQQPPSFAPPYSYESWRDRGLSLNLSFQRGASPYGNYGGGASPYGGGIPYGNGGCNGGGVPMSVGGYAPTPGGYGYPPPAVRSEDGFRVVPCPTCPGGYALVR